MLSAWNLRCVYMIVVCGSFSVVLGLAWYDLFRFEGAIVSQVVFIVAAAAR